jgi:hypothetical protein
MFTMAPPGADPGQHGVGELPLAQEVDLQDHRLAPLDRGDAGVVAQPVHRLVQCRRRAGDRDGVVEVERDEPVDISVGLVQVEADHPVSRILENAGQFGPDPGGDAGDGIGLEFGHVRPRLNG